MLRTFHPLRRVRKHPRSVTRHPKSLRPPQSPAAYPATQSRSPAPSCTRDESSQKLPRARAQSFPSPQYSQQTIASAPRVRASLPPSPAPTRYFSALAPLARTRRLSPQFLRSHSSPSSPPHIHARQRAPPANSPPPAPTASRSKYSVSPLYSPSSNALAYLYSVATELLQSPGTDASEVKFVEGCNPSCPRFE